MILAEEGGICKVMESEQATQETLGMYARKDKSLGMKSKYKDETHIIKEMQDSAAHRGAICL